MKPFFSLILFVIFKFILSMNSFAGDCSGEAVGSCSGAGATSETCGGYYIYDGASSMQCKWNGSYCSNGGGTCVGAQKACGGSNAKNCSNIGATSTTCGNYYIGSDSRYVQCKWKNDGCTDGGGSCFVYPKCHGQSLVPLDPTNQGCGSFSTSVCNQAYVNHKSGHQTDQCGLSGGKCVKVSTCIAP